jgi:hypothetical protein
MPDDDIAAAFARLDERLDKIGKMLLKQHEETMDALGRHLLDHELSK